MRRFNDALLPTVCTFVSHTYIPVSCSLEKSQHIRTNHECHTQNITDKSKEGWTTLKPHSTLNGPTLSCRYMPPRKNGCLRKQNLLYMRARTAKAEHTEKVGTALLRVAFADVTQMTRFMHSETSFRVLYGHFPRWSVGASFGGANAASLHHAGEKKRWNLR